MGLLDNKIALITGTGRGIGHGIAVRFAREGADVVCCSRTEANAAKAAADVAALGRRSWAHAVDVGDAAAVSALTEKILAEAGRVDILVNNAGVTRDGLLMRMSEADWDAVLDTNLKGCFNWIKSLSRAMLKQRAGRIINVASIIGLIGNAGQCNYAASKAGIFGLTKSVAREFASRGITCNAIAPGFIETDMTAAIGAEMRQKLLAQVPLARLGSPDDVASVALFLASGLAGYVTGQVVTVDGGMVM
ncbi:MAG: 3-oxoacyl-[acyl-carrier-protein] reductase [Verrucomicrobia bacterium]|nr:3-oxoacyl-[acyl-carrier-protein] reductase [Verrucomicrobiota bacterium]